jgi:hypothetical protein
VNGRRRLNPAAKMVLVLRIWRTALRVRREIAREPLPGFVERFGRVEPTVEPIDPRLLARAVDRSLRIGHVRPRCLINALVLYRLLHEQGAAAELVIGLPPEAADLSAHAWVELEGYDVGPPPGRNGHEPMARFG